MLQSKAGYIDARPLTASSAKPLATHGRTIHWGQQRKSEANLPVPGRRLIPPRYFGQRPFGCQSCEKLTQGCELSCSTIRTERRISVPTLDSRIGGPCGTTALSPAPPLIPPPAVSAHSA